MFRPQPGEHCERCLAPVKPEFHSNLCRRFHGNEYLCPSCVEYINAIIGPRLVAYLKEYGGCLFDELEWAEERLNVKIIKCH